MTEEFADAVAYGGGLYAAGYCFGAKYVLQLGASGPTASKSSGEDESKAEAASGPTIKAAALAHGKSIHLTLGQLQLNLVKGTMITREDLQGMATPITMVCVDNDQLFSDEIREAGKGFLEAKGVEHEIRVYKGMPHGDYSPIPHITLTDYTRICCRRRVWEPGNCRGTEVRLLPDAKLAAISLKWTVEKKRGRTANLGLCLLVALWSCVLNRVANEMFSKVE